MDLSNLQPAKGSIKKKKRIARGIGSGKGRTAARGHKGQKSRSGYSRRFGFEGGQMPIHRRLPKFGFRNINRIEYKAINIETLEKLAKDKSMTVIDVESLKKAGFIQKNDLVKILGNGELTSKIEVKAHAFSKSAVEAIEKAGGKVEKIQN
ncbi:MAG: 50S ribosomal protein L15 [Bacteroidales bacterium]|nr:50S ribosomal protein L15 [Bacteroidales bacterium]